MTATGLRFGLGIGLRGLAIGALSVTFVLTTDPTAWLTESGRMYYREEEPATPDAPSQPPSADISPGTVQADTGAASGGGTTTPAYPIAQTFKLHSRPGASKVICEGRATGDAGMYRPNGEPREGLIDEVVHEVDSSRLIFEAPKKHQQVWFIEHFGPAVNLGNVLPGDVISLETLRLGLRADTLKLFHGEGG